MRFGNYLNLWQPIAQHHYIGPWSDSWQLFDHLLATHRVAIGITLGGMTVYYDARQPVTGIFLPGKFSPENSPRKVPPRLVPPWNLPPMKSMHGNNVVWLCAKDAVDANLFRLESLILTQAKLATDRNNVGGEYTGVERSGGDYT